MKYLLKKEWMNLINARSSGSLHRQVRRMLILCIAVVVLLSTSVGLGISLYQEVRTRDQLLSNAAQMAADAPLLTEDIRADNAQQYLARTVQRVSDVDMLGVYDIKGKPTVFYDLVSGTGDRYRHGRAIFALLPSDGAACAAVVSAHHAVRAWHRQSAQRAVF